MKRVGILLMVSFLVGCASTSNPPAPSFEEVGGAPTDGVVDYLWEEPMVNIVDVPPGLDPEGHYYRPAHRAAVEVKQGRWRAYEPR